MKPALAAAAAGCLLLTGCTQTLPDPFPELHATEPASQTQPPAADTAPTEDTPAVIPAFVEETVSVPERYALFRETLQTLHDDGTLPNGNALATVGSIEANRFAVCDLDGDGADELLLEITQADVNDCFTAVYDMDADGSLRREVRYATTMRFYSGGIAVAEYTDAVQNSGDFLPYAVAAYDAEGDVYSEIAYVSAIDRAVLAAADLLDEYPAEADTSGTGRVYCIRSDNPVDVTEYEAWYASWHDGITEQNVPYQPLTADAVAAVQPPASETEAETEPETEKESS